AATAEPRGRRPAARALRAREARVRAPLRGAEPARLGVDPDRRHAAHARGGRMTSFGELDLHLIGEGRHERLWEVLGAHSRVHEGATGTAFAVWAPSAKAGRAGGA